MAEPEKFPDKCPFCGGWHSSIRDCSTYQEKRDEVIDTLSNLLASVYDQFPEEMINAVRLDIFNYVYGYLGIRIGPHVE